MRRIRRFLGYPFRFRMLLIEVLCRLVAVSLQLRLTPPSATHRIWGKSEGQVGPVSSKLTVDEICRAVCLGARFVPGANCLVQSVVARTLLRRAGYAAEIRIGVAKESEVLKAHAWVESAGVVVFGGAVEKFTAMPQITTERSKGQDWAGIN